MEYDLLQKSKNEEIQFLTKHRNNLEELGYTQKNYVMKKMKDQLELKEERYIMLLNKLNEINKEGKKDGEKD